MNSLKFMLAAAALAGPLSFLFTVILSRGAQGPEANRRRGIALYLNWLVFWMLLCAARMVVYYWRL